MVLISAEEPITSIPNMVWAVLDLAAVLRSEIDTTVVYRGLLILLLFIVPNFLRYSLFPLEVALVLSSALPGCI